MKAGASGGESVTTGANRERRGHFRYSISAPVWYRIKEIVEGLIANGSGQTVDISSGGVLFESNNPLTLGIELELAIAWPASLSKSVGLTLWLTGKVVRAERNRLAVAIARYAFRTRALPKNISREV
jgi:c-di-GMP-binding flagellar brake protein YcgR